MNPCLLIVDDDLNVVKQLKWTFHDQYEVRHALSLSELERALSDSQPIAALVDMHLPPTLRSPETGIDIIRYLRRTHPDMLIIGISVSQDPHIPVAVHEAGASFFLQKPFTSDSLKSLVSTIC
jgi:DNA-binding NtrC family response regulator